MDDIARLPGSDRAELFAAVSNERGDMGPVLIEKDFWVCWTLKRIFTLKTPPAGLVFKGGTSLSKVYEAIDRFSEDVDLSFDRTALGFGGDNDPAEAPSGKQAQKRLDALSASCKEMLSGRFLPQLEDAVRKALGAAPSRKAWGIEIDSNESDGQTILFRYPAGIDTGDAKSRYMRPVIRLEFGARGEQWPAEQASVSSYAAQAIPKPFKDSGCSVKVLSAERTFWEKATILHALYHLPSEKSLRERQSRHYYDLAKLYEKGVGEKALGDLELLKSVARHKAVFFRSAAARYDEAVPGSLRLVPPESRMKELEADYVTMREMIFGDIPSLSDIFGTLREIERKVNEGR